MQNRKYGRGRETFEPADETNLIEGRHAVSEALRSGRTIDKLYMLYGSNDSALTALKARPPRWVSVSMSATASAWMR